MTNVQERASAGVNSGSAAARSRRTARIFALTLCVGTVLTGAVFVTGALPTVPVPPGNPITEQKRILGKILFWDEQMSTSGTVSCGTCHMPANGGTDPRIARHPGDDRALNTPDDILGSPGTIRSDANNDYLRDAIFALNPQITERSANSMINAAYAPLLFWDGRASGTFRDPLTNEVVLTSGAALESQAAAPPASSVEMAHDAIQWSTITGKLERVTPLALATALPGDVASRLASRPSYGELFRDAFGDEAITPARIAMAIATYQRMLISDQSPWDRFMAGETTAMTANQIAGWNAFQTVGQGGTQCNTCHTAPLFTDNSFRNIGVRPIAEDNGRQGVTGLASDAGRFKVPSLRNVGLKATFMHNGQFNVLNQVMGFYGGAAGVPPNAPIRVNRDPLMNQIALPPQVGAQVQDFIANALRDPRVAAQTFPFDRPTLFTNRPADQATNQGGGVAGTGGTVPRLIAQSPPMIGNVDYRVGLDGARAGASARLGVSTLPPVAGRIVPQRFLPTIVVPAPGTATLDWPITTAQVTPGQVLFVQWFVADPVAAGGQALSAVFRVPLFCPSSGCPTSPCSAADIANTDGDTTPFPQPDGVVDNGDFTAFFGAFFDAGAGDLSSIFAADIANTDGATRIEGFGPDGVLDNGDFSAFFAGFFTPCGV